MSERVWTGSTGAYLTDEQNRGDCIMLKRDDIGANGFTLIEVLVTVAVLAVSLVMVLQLFSIGLRSSILSCDYTTALIYAQGKMEEIRTEPTQGSGTFVDRFYWQTEIMPYEELNVLDEDSKYNVMKLKVIVSWETGPDKIKAVEMVSLGMVEDENR